MSYQEINNMKFKCIDESLINSFEIDIEFKTAVQVHKNIFDSNRFGVKKDCFLNLEKPYKITR